MKILIILNIIFTAILFTQEDTSISSTSESHLFYIGCQVGYYAMKFDDKNLMFYDNNFENRILPSLRFEYMPSNLKNYSFDFNISFFNRERYLYHGLPGNNSDLDKFEFRNIESSSYLLYELNTKYRVVNVQSSYNLYITTGIYNTFNFNRKYESNGVSYNYEGRERQFNIGYSMGVGYEQRFKKIKNLKFNIEYKFYDRFYKSKDFNNIYPLWDIIHFGGLSVMYNL